MVVTVHEDGTIQYLEHDARQPVLSGGDTRRASWIVPSSLVKRLTFRVVRAVFGDHGKLPDWTRSFSGPWIVDLRLSGGPVVGGFSCRQSALAYEVRWVERNVISQRR